ncbi:hypothetical protein SEUCBS139899_010122 [Sporothrix eucalyptigena]
MHYNIVALETMFSGLPNLTVPAPHTCSVVSFERSAPIDVGPRLAAADADIAIITTVAVTAAALDVAPTPRLKLIVAVAAGTDTIDLAAAAARGVRVLNCPGCNVDAVAEHALALFLACRRRLLPSSRALYSGAWPQRGTLIRTAMTGQTHPPRACAAETVALIGYGAVGKRVATLFRALGMRVIVAARKGALPSDGRVPFQEALQTASAVVLCCPRTPETLGLLGEAEFATMQPDCVLVNVARGGVVDEQALLVALRSGIIGGAGVDVYGQEPAGPDSSPLLAADVAADLSINLMATPHTAWVSAQTTDNNARVLQENIDGFILGEMLAERIRA